MESFTLRTLSRLGRLKEASSFDFKMEVVEGSTFSNLLKFKVVRHKIELLLSTGNLELAHAIYA